MVDSFMRTGGRTRNGLAKPLMVDDNGRLIPTKHVFERVLEDINTTGGIVPDDVSNFNTATYYLAVPTGVTADVRVEAISVLGDSVAYTPIMGVELENLNVDSSFRLEESGSNRLKMIRFDVSGLTRIRLYITFIDGGVIHATFRGEV